MKDVRYVILLGMVCASLSLCQAAVKLPPVLGDHMVLQQQMPVPIWGTANPREAVIVSFHGQQKQTTANTEGKWLVKLDPLKAGGPYELTVTGANNTIIMQDVLVGEVWIGSGSGNMQLPANDPRLEGEENLAKLLAAAPYPLLRLGSRNGWQEATEKTCPGFSAQLFAFGVLLQQQLGVPVGVIQSVDGKGGFLNTMVNEADYRADAEIQACIAQYRIDHADDMVKAEADYQTAMQQYAADKAKWDMLPREEKARTTMPRPPKKPLMPGESDRGGIGERFEREIRPLIPYAMRGVLWDFDQTDTHLAGIDTFTAMGIIIRSWRKEWGQGDFPFIYVQKGNGGGCAYDPRDPVTLFAEKFTELPPAPVGTIGDRETSLRMMSYPNTGMVISSDLGPGMYPVNKYGYASRDARVALGMVYGKPIEYYGPLFKEQVIEGGKIRIRYTHVGQGLAIPAGHPKLQGFTIAGEDKKFVWADAAIDGDTVVLSSEKIAQPCFVRYAWAPKILWANLFNKDGLPAIPFHTDP